MKTTAPPTTPDAITSSSTTLTGGTTRMMTPVRLIFAAFAAVALALAAGTYVAPAPANAATCYGDYCSGQDPQASGCSASARTIAHTAVYGTGGEQWVNLRWSDVCKTNWAQVSNPVSSVRAVQSGGYTQGYSSNNGSTAWSKMIYSPSKCVSAQFWGGWGTTVTPCY